MKQSYHKRYKVLGFPLPAKGKHWKVKNSRSVEYREKMSEWARQPKVSKMLSLNAKKQWENSDYKEFMASRFINFYNSNEDYRKRNNKLLN